MKKIEKRHKLKKGKLVEILKNQIGRKFKVYGQLYFDETRQVYFLRGADFVESKIMIKVRKRKYRNAHNMNTQDISEIIGKKKYINVSNPSSNPNYLKDEFNKKKDCQYAFGVIEKFNFNEGEIILLGINPVVVCIDDKKRFHKNLEYINEGKRIIIKYKTFETTSEQINLRGSEIEEIIEIESLILPFNNIDSTLQKRRCVGCYSRWNFRISGILYNFRKHHKKFG